MPETAPALVIAAPASNSGKTVLTLALLRAFRNSGRRMASFKAGPDYIDPAFHAAASGRPCFNLDPWAMREESQTAVLRDVSDDADLIIGEGVMGLFDGARDGTGSTADLASRWSLPVLLIVDAKGQGASVAALLEGFDRHRPDLRLAGVLFNRVGGGGHVEMLKQAAAKAGIPMLGAIPLNPALQLEHRHLGLQQARERQDIEVFLEAAATHVAAHADLEQIAGLARPADLPETRGGGLAPLGQHIAIAEDDAFAFLYPHLMASWRRQGATLSFFSPLADEAPAPEADAIFLPGGYPELYAGKLASATKFKAGMQKTATSDKVIYGECGGFMALGRSLTDRDGATHEMLNLLPVTTSFAAPKRHLGYRKARLTQNCILGNKDARFAAHEFHYASLVSNEATTPLFEIEDATGAPLGLTGAIERRIAGSFIHLIDGM
ncbi:MAG: cobyrinate a,c-diamide synthase [Alphaproteobacteria bacterium]|nr:MAG: cobyrinate a,c-diamide synthase [Alphaproteobacteria bacterium]